MHQRRRLRIAMVVESSAGGTGRHVLDLCEGLLSHNCEPHLIYSSIRIDQMFRDRLERMGSLPRMALPMRTAVGPHDFAAIWAVRNYLKRYGPFDAIHGHSSKGGAIARLAALGNGTKAFYTPHGINAMDPGLSRLKSWVYLSVEHTLKLWTTRMIAVSPEEARAALRLGFGEHRVTIIPNGIGRERLASREAARRALGVAPDAMVIGTVGRLVEQKAPQVLIEAFAKVAGALPQVRLALVGGGPLEQSLRALARQLGICDRIIWLGERDAREVLRGFDLFALASRKEGLPYVLLEAMAAGLPIVATAAAGVELLIDPHVNGIVVPVDSPADLAAALAKIAANAAQARSYGEASRRRAAAFTIDKMVQRTLQMYLECCGADWGVDSMADGAPVLASAES